jgi:hypothetical protein
MANTDNNQTNTTTPAYELKTSTTADADFDKLVSTMLDDETIKKTMRSNGLYSRSDLAWWNVFYRHPRIDPYAFMGPTREYVFFTKPDLHIFNVGDTGTLNKELANVPFFYDLMRRGYNKSVLRDLQYSIDSSTPFIRILSNSKTSNMDLANISVDDVDTSSNLYGTKMFYRKASDHSDEEEDFSIEFEDNRYLDVYLWFKAFDQYEQRKYLGKVTPPSNNYRKNKVLHDQMSIFKFVVAEDMETIVFWAQKFGCYPKGVPREAFSDPTSDGNLKFTVPWKCTFQEDMQPNTISDFNYLASISSCKGIELPVYDENINGVSGENVLVPFISEQTNTFTGYKEYRLKWKV